MGNKWLRIRNGNLAVTQNAANVLFTTLNGVNGVGGGYILTRNNANTANYYDGVSLNGVSYDLGFMKLPEGVKRVWYTLNNGLLKDNSALQSLSAPLTEAFLGMVLVDVQPNNGVNEFFLGAVDLDMNLCKTYNWGVEPNWGAHHHCSSKFVYPTVHAVEGGFMTGSETPLFWAKLDLGMGEDQNHPGYYLVPFLLPEKLVGYYAVKADDTAFARLNQVWFIPVARYLKLYKTQTDPFVAVEVAGNALLRYDDYAMHVVLEGTTAAPTLELACMSTQNGIVKSF